jgi:hypothetical protein
MKRAVIASLAALAVLAAAGPAAAAPRPIHPYRVQTGQRVRLWTSPELGGFQSTSATVTAVDSTGLTVVIKDRTELIAFTDLERMEVRRGWRNLRRFALAGLVVGAVAGVLIEDGGDGEDKLIAGAIGGGVGAAVGTVTAAAIWPAKWVPVDIDQIRKPVADKGALRLSFTLSF